MNKQFIQAAVKLADVLEAENRAIKSQDYPASGVLAPEKAALCQAMMDIVLSSPPKRGNQALSLLATRLNKLVRENQDLLMKAIIISLMKLAKPCIGT